MLKTMNVRVRKILIIFLIISLIYANLNVAIFGIVSYALDSNPNITEATAETVKKHELEIEISDFCKNKMAEEETYYEEKLSLNLNYDKMFNEITIADISTEIGDGIDEEKSEESDIEKVKPNTFYNQTRINKTELIKAIGQDGSLEIKYNVTENKEEQENEKEKNQEPQNEENKKKIVLPVIEDKENQEESPKGVITAQAGLVILNSETEAAEDGYINIVYPEMTDSLSIKIYTNTDKIEECEIINSKKIDKAQDIEKINSIEVTKQIIVKDEKEDFLNTLEVASKPIEYSKTIAELGSDKSQISTSVENKVNFTITMHTNNKTYDLYKNPYFIIELPSIVKTINVDNLIILNNTSFEISAIEEGTLDNGNKAIAIKLEGEQTEYTKSPEENIQIVLATTIVTEELIPTTQSQVNLYYKNENVKTYDGIGNIEVGVSTAQVEFVSNKEVIVESTAIVGDQTITSPKENFNTVTIAPHTYQTIIIKGKAINNIGQDIPNAKILGTATNISQISGVGNIYYTENENATIDLTNEANHWSTENTPNTKKFLVIIDNFAQAQTITFEYYMNLPENIEEDIAHVAKFEVYDSNNQIIQQSQVTINQEAKKLNTYENNVLVANMSFNKTNELEVGEQIEGQVNITNNTDGIITDISLELNLPENLKRKYNQISVNGLKTNALVSTTDNRIKLVNLNLNPGETFNMDLGVEVKEYLETTGTIEGRIKYNQEEIQLLEKVRIIEQSVIDASITTNKLGKDLEENEKIEYKISLKNNGQSHANVHISFPEMKNMNIQKIQSRNLTTGSAKMISSANLKGNLDDISINAGEIVEVYVECLVKTLEKDSTETMYATIYGDSIYNTVTNKITNRVKKTVKNKELNEEQNVEGFSNTVQGIAWIDKNENGQRDENETLLKGVQAVLVDTKTSKEVARKNTNNKGEYKFDNIEEGSYIVEFKYNTTNFTVTNYKEENVDKNLASDIINTTQNNSTIAKTEVIKLSNGKTENINAGFVINKNFDMNINKGITKVTVNNKQGTKQYEFNSNNMAKVEIEGKYLKGSIILVEYEISITNNGELEGYAKLISDKIPEGMKFNSELNPDWYEGNDGNLYSVALANKKLASGETATVKLILTKEMTDDKVVTPVNTASIEETFNEYLIEDKNKDNNIAEATVIISLTTGDRNTYIWLSIIVAGIIGFGIISIIKINKKISTIERRG